MTIKYANGQAFGSAENAWLWSPTQLRIRSTNWKVRAAVTDRRVLAALAQLRS